MNDEIFQLLRSEDPEDRKKAVRELAQLRDREVLRYLATVYKEDPDAEVRDLAVRAGKYVKKQMEAGEWMVAADSIAEDVPAKPTQPPRSTPQESTKSKRKSGCSSIFASSVVLIAIMSMWIAALLG